MGDFGLKHIYLICNLENDLFNDLMTLVLFKNYVHLIMLWLDAVIIWGNPFRHNFHQTAIIILIILYFACVCMLILYNNHVCIVFTAVLLGWVKSGNKLILVMYVSNYLSIPNYNILFQFKSFDVVFLSLPNLI